MLAIYKASAGSGKTFTLAYEYIKMLLGEKDKLSGRYRLSRNRRDYHRHILAVTFTNKATDEMKQRIVHELAVLGGLEPGWDRPSPYVVRLCSELNCSETELKAAAATALRQLLFDFGSFQVSTIDAFFQTILRTFAHDLDISGNYEVDLDTDRAIGQSVRDLFDSLSLESTGSISAAERRQIVNWITQYLLDELKSGRQISLFNRKSQVHTGFLHFVKNISNDTFAQNRHELMQYLDDPTRLQQFARALADSEKTLIADTARACADAIAYISSGGYDTGKAKVNAYLLAQLKKVAETGEETGTSKSADKAFADISTAFNKALNEQLAIHPDRILTDLIARAASAIVEGGCQLKLMRNIRSSLFVLGLLRSIDRHIEQFNTSNNTIFLSDTNTLLREIIGDDDAPFIYERVGVWINHFLIDEFQDTSQLQWENIRPLLAEGQSDDDDSLIIGDEKQCIYRFRFSDPTLLQSRVQQTFADRSEIRGNDEKGNTNWRSSADVVRFNNDLFGAIAREKRFTDIYANVAQQVSPAHADHRGYVKISTIDTSDQKIFAAKSLELMTAEIVCQLEADYRPCDIVVLTRFNSEAADVIAHLMSVAPEIPRLKYVRITSDDAMMVGTSPAVKLIISVMRYMALPEGEQPADDDPMLTKRRRRLREIGRMINRFELQRSSGNDPADSLSNAINYTAENTDDDSIIREIAGSMACFNLPSLVERIIVRYISPNDAKEQNMYISAFVDVVNDFCSRGPADLHAFLHWWDESGHRAMISAPFDEQALRVMSIHKSKGLEFKCVHIPFVDWKMVSFKDYEWFFTGGQMPGIDSAIVPKMLPIKPAEYLEHTQFGPQYATRCREQLLDELNVLYVAFTRAVDELSICLSGRSSSESSDNAGDVVAEALQYVSGLKHEPQEKEIEPQGDGDTAEPEVSVVSVGSPTTPREGEKSRRTAVDPTQPVDMIPYETSDRDDLWATLDIEHCLDYALARDRGILLHDVLARVRSSSDLPHAIAFCSYRGRLPKEEAPEVEAFLAGEFERPDIRPWFEDFKRVLCERPLTLADGTICRPDRVVWTADGHIDVVDYKFGDEHERRYNRQVAAYVNALRGFGYENVRGFIWYVPSGRIVAVEA